MPSVRVDGCEIHYEVTGSGDPVVLVHGLGSSTLDWELQVSALAERHTVITLPIKTMQDYDARLKAAGKETRVVTDPSAGHEWIAAGAQEVVQWFESHP